MRAVGKLKAQGFFHAHAYCVTVLVGAQIVEPVAERENLRIGTALTHLLNAAVYVAAAYVNLAHLLAFKGKVKVQHTMGGRVLGADVYDELVVVEYLQLLHNLGHLLVVLDVIFALELLGGLAVQAYRVQLLTCVIILTQRIAYPVIAQEQASQVVVPCEHYSEKVVYLALIQLCNLPYIADRGQLRFLAVGSAHGKFYVLVCLAVLEYIYGSKALFAPVHSHNFAQKVHTVLALFKHGVAEILYIYEFNLHLCYCFFSSPIGWLVTIIGSDGKCFLS